MYRWVVVRSLCPASSWIARAGAPRIARCEQNVCRLFRIRNRRHTTAMHLLQSGTDTAVIALWLGHESPTTTHGYLEADLAMKERALARVAAPAVTAGRFKASDDLLAFLDRL
jgi:integrase/recombinase XerD